jgi:hypothetical protein
MLANRNNFIPGGFKFIQPEMSNNELGDTSTSFDVLVQKVIELRRANPALTKKNNLSLDFATVANEVDAYNSQICIAHGWTDFVVGGPGGPFLPASRSPLLSRLADAAGSVNRVAAGVRTLLDWLGSGGRPVDTAEAESRAAICVTCPLNKPGNFLSYFTAPVAKEIGLQLEMKNKLSLKTSKDNKLHICTGCDCPLQMKLWTPMEHILKFTTEETKKRLDARCWILKA